jgi:hypothetical protein
MVEALTKCDNCGACCFEQGSPPGYLLLLSEGDHSTWPDQEDLERVKSLPSEARRRLTTYRVKSSRGQSSEGRHVWRDEYNVDVEALGLVGAKEDLRSQPFVASSRRYLASSRIQQEQQ